MKSGEISKSLKKKVVEKIGKQAQELKEAEDKNFAWENFDHSKLSSC